MIPICLILFILFIAVITFAIKRADSAQAKVTEEFWEKERKANSTLRGDTTDLCYITIPEKFFPLNNDKINDLRDKTLVNLTGMTNTDLKLKYGILNFKKLSEYDDNFTKFVSMLPDYYNRLNEAGYESLANELLELAVEQGADFGIDTVDGDGHMVDVVLGDFVHMLGQGQAVGGQAQLDVRCLVRQLPESLEGASGVGQGVTGAGDAQHGHLRNGGRHGQHFGDGLIRVQQLGHHARPRLIGAVVFAVTVVALDITGRRHRHMHAGEVMVSVF
jgi:hypothetical protein